MSESPTLASLGTSGTPARTLTSYSNSGNIISMEGDIKSDPWKGWTRKSQAQRSLQTSGDLIGHTTPVASDDFNHWPNKKKHLRMQDSGDILSNSGDVRSKEFSEVNRRGKPVNALRSSGDVLLSHDKQVKSDDFMALDTRMKKSPYKNVSNVPLGSDNPQPEVAVPGYRAPKPSGKKTSNFDSNLPQPEDLVRTYRPSKKMIVVPGTESQATTLNNGQEAAAGDVHRPGRRVFPQQQQATNNVLSPSTRDSESEVQPRAYLGARKARVQAPQSQQFSDERRPCRRLFQSKPNEHGNIVQHTEDRPHTAPARFSKRIFESQSGNAESKGSADEELRFQKKVFRDALHSQGLGHDHSPAPAPVFAHTGYNQARELKSAFTESRAQRYKNHGDIVGWTDVKL